MPFSSPTTTSAVNENRRPPLTTLATRLISTTRSWRSRPAGLTLLSGTGMLVPEGSGGVLDSDRQAALAGALGQLADAAVVAVAAAVENRALHAGGLGTLGQEAADALGLLHPPQVAHAGLDPGRRGHGVTALVVDDPGDHVGHQRPREAVQGAVLAPVGGALDQDLTTGFAGGAPLQLDHDVAGDALGELPLGPVDPHAVGLDRHGDPGGHGDGL